MGAYCQSLNVLAKLLESDSAPRSCTSENAASGCGSVTSSSEHGNEPHRTRNVMAKLLESDSAPRSCYDCLGRIFPASL
jgi:hypothetical protein